MDQEFGTKQQQVARSVDYGPAVDSSNRKSNEFLRDPPIAATYRYLPRRHYSPGTGYDCSEFL